MRMALSLALKADGYAQPNPMVGAVIVRNGVVLGKGYHQRFGEAHAEVNAIADAKKHGHDIAGADIYVTLEPCSHFGKTPPCANAVVNAKLGRVFCAIEDPFPQVSGKGIALLKQHGVQVHVGILETESRELNRAWLKRLTTGLPWVTLKWAQSIDGKIAASSGDSQWISGPAARKLVHQIRGRVDAVMVGIGTALADDPQLTARDVKPRRIAQRVVIDPHLKLPDTAKLLAKNKLGNVEHLILATSLTAMQQQRDKVSQLRALGVDVHGLEEVVHQADPTPLKTPFKTTLKMSLNLHALLQYLVTTHDMTNILVEGGGRLHGSLLQQGLVDQMIVFISPKIIGDDTARSGVAGLNCPTMAQSKQLTLHKSKQLDQDMLVDYRIR